MASDVISGLYYLRDSGLVVEEEEKTYDPFSMYISTWGGSALDMFAVYDTMNSVVEGAISDFESLRGQFPKPLD